MSNIVVIISAMLYACESESTDNTWQNNENTSPFICPVYCKISRDENLFSDPVGKFSSRKLFGVFFRELQNILCDWRNISQICQQFISVYTILKFCF